MEQWRKAAYDADLISATSPKSVSMSAARDNRRETEFFSP
jgi:hypothetical protein